MASEKHVLLICVDQLSMSRLGLSGDTVAMTPTIDFLGRNGLNFDNLYSTCPICIPARRSLMTGMSPRSHGDRVYQDTMPMPSAVTLAQAFSNAGYQTYAVGKMHVYPQRNRIGFDDVILMEEGRNEFGVYDDYQIWLGEQGYISDEFLHTIGNNTYYTRPWHLPEITHPTTWATKEMMRMIKRKDPGKPAFFYISYAAPHPPLLPLDTYLDMFTLDEMQLPDLADQWAESDSPILKTFTGKAHAYSEKEMRLALRAYYATCTHIDSQIRLLLGTLRESNMLDNTIIVFLSDHGDMLFEHGCIGKRLFYEGSCHVPFIISGPPALEYRAKVDTHQIASLEDVMPTLLDMCGIDIPETVDGISLISEQRHTYIFGEITEGTKATRMIMDGKYKLIYYPCGNMVQLFDIEHDKLELRDLSGCADLLEIKEKLVKELIENLHDGDEQWVKDGRLIGFDAPMKNEPVDFGLHNQRGSHWPPPGQYSNFGNSQK